MAAAERHAAEIIGFSSSEIFKENGKVFDKKNIR